MNKTNLNIVRRSYKRLTQDSLAIFASQVFDRMAANDKYKDLAVDVEKLGALVLNYHQLVKAAQLGDRSIITEKNQLRKELLMQLERIAKRLEYRYEGVDKWIVDSGMELLNDRADSAVALIAAKVGTTRLIDNLILQFR